MVQVFRLDQCGSDTLTIKPRTLDPSTTYMVTNLDTNESIPKTGKDLMYKGLQMKAVKKPAALVIHYKTQ